MKQFLILCILIIVLFSCKEKEIQKMEVEKVISTDLPEWAKSATIYEVNIRQFTPEGTFNAFSEHLPRLKEMGIDILWIMPIFPISETKKKGGLGSYYSVTDFQAINPEFGTMEDVDNLIQKIHDLGMKVILDWVPNHTGWDHVWIKEHPEWYTQDDEGNIVDPRNEKGESMDWTDVADLNYDSKEMRKEMLRQLKWWVEEKGIDGYRMDIAFGVPDDFWAEVRDTLYAIKPIFMLAESENANHRNDSTFHATYGWNVFHVMNSIAKSEKKVADFVKAHQENASTFKRGGTLNFTSNHDENAWNGTVFERLGEGHKGWATVMTLLDGFPLIYGGMEEPMKKRLLFFDKDSIEFKNFEYSPFYTHLFSIKKAYEPLWNSPYGADVTWIDTNSEVLAFHRSKGKQSVRVFFNTTNKPIKITSQLLLGMDITSNLPSDSNTMNTDQAVSFSAFETKIILNY